MQPLQCARDCASVQQIRTWVNCCSTRSPKQHSPVGHHAQKGSSVTRWQIAAACLFVFNGFVDLPSLFAWTRGTRYQLRSAAQGAAATLLVVPRTHLHGSLPARVCLANPIQEASSLTQDYSAQNVILPKDLGTTRAASRYSVQQRVHPQVPCRPNRLQQQRWMPKRAGRKVSALATAWGGSQA